jgi:malate permease and related proteins
MLQATADILPLLLIFLAGYGLKCAKMLTSDDGSSLLKLIFYAGAPALIFTSVLKVEINASMLWLCFLAPVIGIITVLVTFLLRRSALKSINIKTFGALLAGAAIMNTGFLIPFVERIYGPEGLAQLAVIDAFNAFVAFGLVYAIVVRLGNNKPDTSFVMKKLLLAPPLWALTAAIILKVIGVAPPVLAMDTLGVIAMLVSPVILIALGLKFTPRIKRPKLLLVPLVLRFGLGALIGVCFVKLLGLEGLTAEIALFASIAPIGFNSITFAELENLDVEFAASQVSIALIAALVAAPFAIQILQYV